MRILKINFIAVLMGALCLLSGCSETPGGNIKLPVKQIRIKLPKDAGQELKNIASIFATRVQERSGAKVLEDEGKALTIEFLVKPGIGAEGFSIVDGGNGSIQIIGNDLRGLLYGAGKLLHTSVYTNEGFEPGTWRGTSIPEKEIRGIYFATHFYNYYQTAPVEKITRYIEDLALWGTNNIMVWYDMHHFKGFNDPEAVRFRERLSQMIAAAKNLDLGIAFTLVGNEAYPDAPANLRAVAGGFRGAIYPEDICPNKPGGLEYILKVRGEFFDWCSKFNPAYICLWPYDPGGCGSSDCQPWGSNGFVTCAKAVSKLAKEKLPDTKVILSTWFMDNKEWNGLSKELDKEKDWVNVLMAEHLSDEYKGAFTDAPDKIPIVGFPEISMYNSFPWGGFGANPLPTHLSGQWQKVTSTSSGGFPYSEGIFDDINKVVYSQFYWKSNSSIDETLKEYIRYEFGVADADSVVKVIHTLEQNHHWRWWPGKLEGVKLQLDWFPSKNVKPQADPGAEEAYAIVKETNKIMTHWGQASWRWRILFIRAMLDAELKANGGSPNETCVAGFRELMDIYHTTEKTDPAVKPPLSESGK